MVPDEQSAEYAAHVGAAWAGADPTIRSWWQNPVAWREYYRRITGDPNVSPPMYFKARYCDNPFGAAISLGAGAGLLEQEMLDLEVCESIFGVDVSRQRVDGANAAVPDHLRDRLRFECHNLEVWRPTEQVDLVIARDVLHHIARLEELCEALTHILTPDGLIYCDEFIGPKRFQWTDEQLGIINRLLDRLSDDLAVDLVTNDGTRRLPARRPDLEQFIALDPSESVRSDDIPGVMASYFDVVEVRPCGGAVFQQFFNRIMGNFADHDDLVRLAMEFDLILCETGVLASNYQWAVYRNRAPQN